MLLVISRSCPTKVQSYTFYLVYVWRLASRRELRGRDRVRSYSQVDWRMRRIYSSSVSSFLMTVPQRHCSSMQKSTTSPSVTSGSTLWAQSCSKNSYFLFLYSSSSDQSKAETMIYRSMPQMRVDRLNCSKVRGYRQREQACLWRRDCSRHGRQKAWPHSERQGRIMSSRQIGQLNFQIFAGVLNYSFTTLEGCTRPYKFFLGLLERLARIVLRKVQRLMVFLFGAYFCGFFLADFFYLGVLVFLGGWGVVLLVLAMRLKYYSLRGSEIQE